MDPLRFTVALSFPGEHREFVSRVADHLASTLNQERVLYDKYHDVEFARVDLNIYLPALYRKQSELIVIFLCPEYAAKLWCRLEWRHISQLIASMDAKRIMFLSFGNPGDLSDLGILSGDGYIDVLPLKPETVAEKILKRLKINQGIKLPAPDPVSVAAMTLPVDIDRIIKYAPEHLIGRENETSLLNDAWAKVRNQEPKRPHVLTFVALGGEGKTSLVAKWAAELAHQGWPGCDAVFAWSFYSQGTRDQLAASSDLFLKEALTFFGDDADKEFAASPAGAFEKGQRLARIVGQRRSLLILDGLEPLQYPTEAKAFKPGELKDQGIAKLLKDLASTNFGLCIVTTRIEMPDLNAFKGGVVIETHLKRLPRAAGVSLLKSLGVKGSERRDKPLKDSDPNGEKVNELEKLVEDVKGHALTLTLLGGFLNRAFHGDIRQRDRVKFEKADERMDGGHAFRTVAAHEQWLLRDGGSWAFSTGPPQPAASLPCGVKPSPASLNAGRVGRRRLGILPQPPRCRETAHGEPRRIRRAQFARCASALARILCPATAHATTRRLARGPPPALRTSLRDHGGQTPAHARRPPAALPSRGARLPGGVAAGGV